MRSLFLCVVFLCSVLGACASRPAPPPPSNSNISFGIYDISSSGPFSAVTDAMRELNTSDAPQTGNLGGNVERQAAADSGNKSLSLAQTSASAINTASSDRKIIRNAELNLEAENPEEAQRRITAIAESNGGGCRRIAAKQHRH